jgi:hypothetical protein
MTEIERQLQQAGYLDAFTSLSVSEDGSHLMGRVPCDIVDALILDARFANGVFYQLHRDDFDPGADLTEFRSYNGTLGKGSLQLVIDRRTGACYADVDKFNPYQDVVRIIGHTFGEVIPNWFRRRTRRNADHA